MIPVEIGEPSPRSALFKSIENENELRANLDLLQEVREIAHIREYAAKIRAVRKYDQRILQNSGSGIEKDNTESRDQQADSNIGRTLQSSGRNRTRSLSTEAFGRTKDPSHLEHCCSTNSLNLCNMTHGKFLKKKGQTVIYKA
ncbi:hypothetical protein CR513_45457, partial [Mucuna pruriens]